MSSLPAVSLFSNCGAGDIGYARAGFSFKVMAELVDERLSVCLKNHKSAKGIPGDLRETYPDVIKAYWEISMGEELSLLCACPPCQGMSSARSGRGKQDDVVAGSRDGRNLLVTVIAEVARALSPKIVVVENVPAFFSRRVPHPQSGLPVSAANFLIGALSGDYSVFPLLSDLADYGVPQSRKRAFLTFVRRDVEGLQTIQTLNRAPFPIPTHDPTSGGASPISIIEALEKAGLPRLDAIDEQHAVANGFGGLHAVPVWGEKTYRMVSAIPSNSGKSAWENDFCIKCGAIVAELAAVRCPKCSALLPRPIVQESTGEYRLVRGFKTSYRRMHPRRPAATITTASGHVGSDYTIHPSQNRLLSPLECAILQTIPSDFDWGSTIADCGVSAVREMIGEAVPPAFTELHGRVIRGVLTENWEAAPVSKENERVQAGMEKLSAAAERDSVSLI